MATPSDEFPPAAMRRLRHAVAQQLGLAPQDWVLNARVRERMDLTGTPRLEGYLRLLEAPREQTALAELLRVGETRFYRHETQMRGVVELVLPELRRGSGPVRAWSAGCATGEEAYTLAMVLARGLEGHRPVRVLASDISPSSLQRARAAVYRKAALESLPASYHAKFRRHENNSYEVSPDIRSLVDFEERNLVSGNYPTGLDLIFCRNVLIYFEDTAKQDALRRLVRALAPGAFLFLGYSESLREIAGLEVVSSGSCTAYRRTTDALPAATLSRPSRPVASLVTATNASPKAECRLKLHGQYQDGKRLAAELENALGNGASHLVIELDGADFLSTEAATALRNGLERARSRGITMMLRATREGHQRFLRRHDLPLGGQR